MSKPIKIIDHRTERMTSIENLAGEVVFQSEPINGFFAVDVLEGDQEQIDRVITAIESDALLMIEDYIQQVRGRVAEYRKLRKIGE